MRKIQAEHFFLNILTFFTNDTNLNHLMYKLLYKIPGFKSVPDYLNPGFIHI